MRPRDTVYRLAKSPHDYHRVHGLLAETETASAVKFPTVYAERDGRMIGVLGTKQMKVRAIVAGPLAVAKTLTNPTFVIIRLIEVYEALLQQAGVTIYLFAVRADNEKLVTMLTGLGGLEPIQKDGEVLWFQRTLPGRPHAADA